MTYYLLLIFIIGLSLGCSSRITKQDSANPDNYYPRWLKTDSYRTNQTSGITFISEDESGNDEFILIDDIGKLHRLQILQDLH